MPDINLSLDISAFLGKESLLWKSSNAVCVYTMPYTFYHPGMPETTNDEQICNDIFTGSKQL